jgi:uncharacterized protein YqgV (UPF0045/DUF77 family)
MSRRDTSSHLRSQLETAVRTSVKETLSKAKLKAELTAMDSRLEAAKLTKGELKAAADDLLSKIEALQATVEATTKVRLAQLYDYISEARSANSRLLSNSEQDLSKAVAEVKKKLEGSVSCLSDLHSKLHSLYCISCGSNLQTSCRLCKAIRV